MIDLNKFQVIMYIWWRMDIKYPSLFKDDKHDRIKS